MTSHFPLQGEAELKNPIQEALQASWNQNTITRLPFASHLSCLQSVPANAISAPLLGDLPVYSHLRACRLCTPRSLGQTRPPHSSTPPPRPRQAQSWRPGDIQQRINIEIPDSEGILDIQH